MAREQGSNNYSNENYMLLGDNNNIREMDSNFKILGFTSNLKEITKEQYWYESQDIF